MTTFAPRDLYGGAVAVDLPSNFADVSDIRQVPDTQEVWLDRDGLTSVIVDILERVDGQSAETDEAALKFHFDDIVSGTGDTTQVWLPGDAVLSKMPDKRVLTVFATQHPSPQATVSARNPRPDFTGILLTLIRLVEQETDIVVTVNVPHVAGEYRPDDVDVMAGRSGPLLDSAHAIRQRILQTFEIKDYGLFGN